MKRIAILLALVLTFAAAFNFNGARADDKFAT